MNQDKQAKANEMGRFDMESETGNTCPSCGAPVKEGTSFCTKCGAALTPVEGAAAAAAYQPAPTASAAPETKRGKAPLILGIIGGVLVIGGIVALVLYLAVWSGGGGGADTPQALSQKYMDAMEKGDVDAYMACFPPDFFEDMPFMEELGIDLKDLLEASFQLLDVKFDGVSLQVESETGDRAVVVTTKGIMLIDTLGMEAETDLADQPLEFIMVEENGNWYLTEDPMQAVTGTGMDLDIDNLEDLDLDDFDLQLEEDCSSGG